MIHAPKDGYCGDAYRALIDAKKEGKIKWVWHKQFC
jgi:hypothetical protein